MMIPQVPHGLPKVGFVRGAEDFRRRALVFGIRRPEMNAPPPRAILGPADRETDSDTLPFEFYGGEIMNDGGALVGRTVSCR